MNINNLNDFYVIPPGESLIKQEEQKTVELDFSKIVVVEKDNKKDIDVFDDIRDQVSSTPEKEVSYVDPINLEIAPDCEYIINLFNNSTQPSTMILDVLKENYSNILTEMVDNGNNRLINAFTQPHILNMMGQALYSIQLKPVERIYCNKIIYDFLTIKNINMTSKDVEAVRNSMFVLGKIVNRDIIPQLMTLNISEELATDMTIARYSSQKDIINVKRLNVKLVNQPADFMTEDMIVNIYGKLFTSATQLMEGIMFDVWSDYDLDTEDKLEVYATINLALLSILNDLNSNVMNQVLHNFLQDKALLYTDNPIRFNIKSFSEYDYPRLKQMLDYIDSTDGVQSYI